jgi:hypothetical protein
LECEADYFRAFRASFHFVGEQKPMEKRQLQAFAQNRRTVTGNDTGVPFRILPVVYYANEIPQAANRVVGFVGRSLRTADRVVGAELFVG